MVRKLKKPNAGNSNDIISRAKKMQEEMLKVQEQLKDEKIEYQVAGGAVKVILNGQKEILDIKINYEILEDAVNDKNSETIEELLVTAINEALKKAEELSEEKMGEVTGGVGIPGLF